MSSSRTLYLMMLTCCLLTLAACREGWAQCRPEYGWQDLGVLSGSPPLRRDHAMAYDKLHRQVLLFGGLSVTNPRPDGLLDDTWVLEGTIWTRKFPATSPPPRRNHRLSYDAARGTIVLFGGDVRTGGIEYPRNDVWEWDGSNWTELPQIGPRPTPRSDMSMAYDSSRNVHVLFGGFIVQAGNGFQLSTNDTWEFDGAANQWILKATLGPTVRGDAGMAFDAERGEMVLSGGSEFALQSRFPPAYADTWTWRGTTWQSNSVLMPQAVAAHIMVYDEFNKVVWVSGGRGYDSDANFFTSITTLAWNGGGYYCDSPDRSLNGVCGGPINPSVGWAELPAAYDSDRLRVVVFDESQRTYVIARGNLQPVNFVDWRNPTPPGDGSAASPFAGVRDAVSCVTDGSSLFLQSGSYGAGPITIHRRVELIPLGGSVTIR